MDNSDKQSNKIKEQTTNYSKWISTIFTGCLAASCYAIGSQFSPGSLLYGTLVPISGLITVICIIQLFIAVVKN